MAKPVDRASFKEYCLRKLGKPVIEINVDDDQVDDRIDEALSYFYDYHYDGTKKIYYKYQLSQTDFDNKYIPMPDNVIGAVSIYNVGIYMGIHNMFNIRYQIALNDLYTLTSQSMIPYYMAMSHMQFLEEILVGSVPIRYNRKENKLWLDMDWNKVQVGDYLMVVAYETVDPDTMPKVWADRWLQNYTTALIKKQWASNLTKFKSMTLPGNIQFNADKLYDDAQAEIDKLEERMSMDYALPPDDMVG